MHFDRLEYSEWSPQFILKSKQVFNKLILPTILPEIRL